MFDAKVFLAEAIEACFYYGNEEKQINYKALAVEILKLLSKFGLIHSNRFFSLFFILFSGANKPE